MKVLLVGINAKYIHTNLAIRYLKQTIKKLDIATQLYEPSINNHYDHILMEVYEKNPDILGFSCYIWNIEMVLRLAQSIKEILPKTKIVLGGPEVSFETCDFFVEHNYIDFIIKGEGEEPFYNLTKAIINGDDYKKIQGLLTGEFDNGVSKVHDLNQIDFPYMDEDLNQISNQIIYYEASRGCPYSCSYCLSSTSKGVRYIDIHRVKKELEILTGYTQMIKFVDRTFNCNTEITKDLLMFIRDLNTQTTFHLEISAHLITKEILDILKTMPNNRIQLEIGVQTTNPQSVKAIQRTTDFPRLSEVVQEINTYQNIHQHLDLIAGLPYEDYDSFVNSFNDVMALKPNKLQLGFLKLLRGSKIRNEHAIHGYKFNTFPPYEVLENNYITYAQLIKLKRIEHVLETFYNSHRFDYSMDYLHEVVGNYFEVYELILKTLERDNLLDTNISHEKHYEVLLKTYSGIRGNIDMFKELLKFDLLCHKRTHTFPIFLGEASKIKERVFEFLKDPVNIQRHLPNLTGVKPTEIYKNIIVERFEYNPFTKKEEETYILFDYTSAQGIFLKPRILEITL